MHSLAWPYLAEPDLFGQVLDELGGPEMLRELVLVFCQSLWNHGVSANLATAVPKPFCVHSARAMATPGGERLPWSKARCTRF